MDEAIEDSALLSEREQTFNDINNVLVGLQATLAEALKAFVSDFNLFDRISPPCRDGAAEGERRWFDAMHYRKTGRMAEGLLTSTRDMSSPHHLYALGYLPHDRATGVRPFSGITFWHSPDLMLSPVTNLGTAKVEHFLVDPTIGFSTQFAENLTLARVPQAFVPALGAAETRFVWTVPPSQSGHKCLFARVFSFSPLDLPVDDVALDPRLDRHVAQLNLDILGQAQAVNFNLVHRANARIDLTIRALQPTELMALRHPALAGIAPFPDIPKRGWAELRLRKGGGEVKAEPMPEGLRLSITGRGISLDDQKQLGGAMRAVLRAIGAGKTQALAHRDLFARFREMTREARQTRLSLRTPRLGIPKGQAIGVEVIGIDQVAGDGPMGGLTLVVSG
ncbi:hypothetical protein [Rhodovulum visakhapatnamense]|uniref:Uncharacterized protein n=1 Tax=Rhodovulum visakhapatnamense TaxID=364297 RepID=A0A4R8G2B9_9RHOB|nr:hypothetical protein [Rhodovulum visakhapatnamense]TDX29237.1 hypothetical protein EV657_10958 [Rhodovulum visakhapatnamense]